MYIRAKVFTKSKKESCIQTGEHSYEIHCREKAEQNLANKRILKILAEHLEIPQKKLNIISGHQRPQKMIEIRDCRD